MRSFVVISLQPRIEVSLQSFNTFVESRPKNNAEEFIQHRTVEPLNETVGLWRAHLGTTMLDLIEAQIELIGMGFGPAKLTTIVGQDGPNRQVMSLVERHYIIVDDERSRLRLFAGVEITEGIAVEGIHHRM